MVLLNKSITMENIATPVQQIQKQKIAGPGSGGADFETLLKAQLEKNAAAQRTELQFSKHARERVEQRGIQLTESLLSNLTDAVERARIKGARDIVVIDDIQAFIVNVPSNTVVTAVSEPEMKDNVFTNIDSAVII